MTDQTLFDHGADSDEPALVEGFGPVPGELARRIARTAAESAKLWLRRLYAHPDTCQLVAMDSRRRTFDGGSAEFLITRDQVCRTPWCDAPVRHGDHVVPFEDGGVTAARARRGRRLRGDRHSDRPCLPKPPPGSARQPEPRVL